MAIELKIFLKNNLEDKMKKIICSKINDTLVEINQEVVPLTPVGKSRKGYTGGRLRKGWAIIPAVIKKDRVVGYIHNSVHYAGHVNYGHRTRLGLSRKKSKARGKKVVEGQHFVEKALKNLGIKIKNSR